MQQGRTPGLIAALITGGIFAVVTGIEGTMARTVGAINASLLEHLAAGLLAVIGVAIVLLRGSLDLSAARSVMPLAGVGAVLVIFAVAGVAYAVPRIGVAAGNLALVAGQMTVAVTMDTLGVAGYERIPLTPMRAAGLLLMVVGTYLVLPRNG